MKLTLPFKEIIKSKAIFSLLFNALAKGVYFIFILLVGRLLSASSQTDVYFFTVEFIKVIIGYTLIINSDILIPQIIAQRMSNNLNLGRFLGFFYTAYAIIGILATFIVVFFPQFFLHSFSKFSSKTIENDYLIFCFLFPTVLLNILSNLQSSVLIAYNYFVTPPLITFLTNCLSLVIFYLFHKTMGIQGAVMGIIISSVFNNLILSYYLNKYCKIKIVPTFKIDFSIFSSLKYATLVFIASSIYNLGLIYLLTASEETTTTAVNNAVLIAFIPHQFIGVQLTTILGNKYAELYNTQKYEELKIYIKKTVVLLSILILPICFFNIFFLTDIITLVIGKKASEDWWYFYKVGMLLKYLALPAYFNSIYLCGIRLFTSTLRIKTPSLVQCAMNIVLLSAYYIGLRYYNIKGFCVASFIAYGLMFILGLILIVHFLRILTNLQTLKFAELKNTVLV
jgi:O-antigen/teichoic acid export membrane protein